MQEQKEVLAAAKAALEDTFGPDANKHTVKITSTPSNGLTASDLNTIVKEVGGKSRIEAAIAEANVHNSEFKPLPENSSKQKSIAESKKIIETFTKNMESYPKHLSYEGSVVLCSLIGLKQNNNISLNGLPKTDVELIYSQIPLDTSPLSFSVELDDQQDFKLKCVEMSTDLISPKTFNLRFFNSVIRPNTSPSDIPIKQDGNKVTVGSNLVLDQQRIQKLVGNAPPEKTRNNEEESPRRQPVAGRNAYEIRSDILTLAVDFILKNNPYGKEKSVDEVLALAKRFYSFVEKR
jgi:hypothetical protein